MLSFSEDSLQTLHKNLGSMSWAHLYIGSTHIKKVFNSLISIFLLSVSNFKFSVSILQLDYFKLTIHFDFELTIFKLSF